nr:hypothetical protein CFP56_44453 [Quercus suber]
MPFVPSSEKPETLLHSNATWCKEMIFCQFQPSQHGSLEIFIGFTTFVSANFTVITSISKPCQVTCSRANNDIQRMLKAGQDLSVPSNLSVNLPISTSSYSSHHRLCTYGYHENSDHGTLGESNAAVAPGMTG